MNRKWVSTFLIIQVPSRQSSSKWHLSNRNHFARVFMWTLGFKLGLPSPLLTEVPLSAGVTSCYWRKPWTHSWIFLPLAASRRRRRRDQVRLLGVRDGQPAGPLGHPRLQDAAHQQQRHHLLLQPPHALRHPHVVRPRQRKPPDVAKVLR